MRLGEEKKKEEERRHHRMKYNSLPYSIERPENLFKPWFHVKIKLF